MPSAGGKQFKYTIKGISDAQKMHQSLGEEREAKRLEETKNRIRANKQKSSQKAPIRKALRTLGFIQQSRT
jgi:hypothetical protein